MALYEISGPLFFGAAQKAMAALEIVGSGTKVVILLMDEVHAMDATGLVALESALAALRKRRCLAILSGVRPQPMKLLEKEHLRAQEGILFCADPAQALENATLYFAGQPPRLSIPPPAPPPVAEPLRS